MLLFLCPKVQSKTWTEGKLSKNAKINSKLHLWYHPLSLECRFLKSQSCFHRKETKLSQRLIEIQPTALPAGELKNIKILIMFISFINLIPTQNSFPNSNRVNSVILIILSIEKYEECEEIHFFQNSVVTKCKMCIYVTFNVWSQEPFLSEKKRKSLSLQEILKYKIEDKNNYSHNIFRFFST